MRVAQNRGSWPRSIPSGSANAASIAARQRSARRATGVDTAADGDRLGS